MVLLGLFICGLIATFFVVYYGQFVANGVVLYWTIPLYILLFMVLTLAFILSICYIITLFVKPNKKLFQPRSFHRFMIKAVIELLMSIYRLQLVVIGKEKLPRNQAFLLVSNHQSNIDPIASIWGFKEFNLTYIMKDAIMKIPLIGRWLFGAGHLPLNRKDNRKGLETIITATKRIEHNLHPIAVYPEGTRSKSPYMNEFRNGVFKIAQKSKAPIAVMALDNSYKVKWRFPWRRTKILLEIIDVIPYENYQELNSNELGDYVHHLIEQTLQNRRAEFDWLKPKRKKED
ncbi:MAG: lysophospholipid acyltransferase family protein [Bacilli bacterium]|jgi:1-acyl-sn-glycerol-3-phosphate acyltransferase|nr:lysophospholipid acyltransferase family protein [Bacilli bacterium]MDY0064585.1 lysophospholipid acyltransferase family protein [Bacilli bacterium]